MRCDGLPEPHPPEQQDQRSEKSKPCFPPNARLLRHAEHPVHRAFNLVPAVLKLIVHLLRKRRRVANFVADEVRQLLFISNRLATTKYEGI